MSDVTRILNEIEAGEAGAAERLLPLVYNELRRMAARRLARERPGQTLQPTALVHEVYLRLVEAEQQQEGEGAWKSRGHFFAAAAEAMRRILVEGARRKRSLRRGGGAVRIACELDSIACGEDSVDLLALDEALVRLAVKDPRKARLVELRFFSGLTMGQAAEALGISVTTAQRDWAFARAWLHREMAMSGPRGE